MEWKPDKISKSELEKKQAEFAKKAMDMAKRSEPAAKRPNADKGIAILTKPQPAESVPKKPEPVDEIRKPLPEKPLPAPEKPLPEIEPYIVEKAEGIEDAVPPVIAKRVREARIDAEFDFEATIYKKLPAEEPDVSEIEPVDDSQCEDITDNPFGKTDEKKHARKCPPNFNEYIKKHNEEHCVCEKCKPPKKKWI